MKNSVIHIENHLVQDSLLKITSKDPNKLTKEQKKAISSILYNKIHNI